MEMLRNFHGRDWTDDRGLSFHWSTLDCILVIVLLVLEPIVIPLCYAVYKRANVYVAQTVGFHSAQLPQLEPVVVVVGFEVVSNSNIGMSSLAPEHGAMEASRPVGQLCWSRSF